MINFIKELLKKYREIIVYLIVGVMTTIFFLGSMLCSRTFPQSRYSMAEWCHQYHRLGSRCGICLSSKPQMGIWQYQS